MTLRLGSLGWIALFLMIVGIGFAVGVVLIGTEPWQMTLALEP